MILRSTPEFKDFKEISTRLGNYKSLDDITINIISADLPSLNLDVTKFNREIKPYFTNINSSVVNFSNALENHIDFIPYSLGLEFIKSFNSFLLKIFDLPNKDSNYQNFMENYSNPQNSIYVSEFDSLCIKWSKIFPYISYHVLNDLITNNDLRKRYDESSASVQKIATDFQSLKEQYTIFTFESNKLIGEFKEKHKEYIKDSIQKMSEDITVKVEDKLTKMNELLGEAKKQKNDILNKASIDEKYKSFERMEDDVTKKKQNVLICIWVLVGILITLPIVSFCTTDFVFARASNQLLLKNGLSFAYIVKSSLPFLGLFSLSSVLLFYLFRLYKSYLHLIDSYKFKRSLIESMLFLTGSTELGDDERKLVISKVIDAISVHHTTGFVDTNSNKDDIQMLTSQLFSILTKKSE